MKLSLEIILVLVFSLGCLAFSITYAQDHPQSSLPAYLSYSSVGLLGIFVGIALALQNRKLDKLEKLIMEFRKNT